MDFCHNLTPLEYLLSLGVEAAEGGAVVSRISRRNIILLNKLVAMVCLSGRSGGKANTRILRQPSTTHGMIRSLAWKPGLLFRVNVNLLEKKEEKYLIVLFHSHLDHGVSY